MLPFWLIFISEFLIFPSAIALQAFFRKWDKRICSDFACSAAVSANDDKCHHMASSQNRQADFCIYFGEKRMFLYVLLMS